MMKSGSKGMYLSSVLCAYSLNCAPITGATFLKNLNLSEVKNIASSIDENM